VRVLTQNTDSCAEKMVGAEKYKSGCIIAIKISTTYCTRYRKFNNAQSMIKLHSTKKIISAIITSTSSLGIPASVGIFNAPTFKPPNNIAASTTPIAVLAPNNATAIPSKPKLEKIPCIDILSNVPCPSIQQASTSHATEKTQAII